MKTITMMQFRKSPGEFIIAVRRDGESFLLTSSGKPVAKLVPVDDTIEVLGDGTIKGEKPLTFGRKL